jgi:hypothetical protein
MMTGAASKRVKKERRREDRARLAKRRQGQVLDEALAAARLGETPKLDVNDCYAVVHIVDPDDDEADIRRPSPKVGALRDDPVAWLFHHGHLAGPKDRDRSDARLRFEAARAWQSLCGQAEIGRVMAVDCARVMVDGGGDLDNGTDRRLSAQSDLLRLDAVLGMIDARLLRWVLGEGHDLTAVARRMGSGDKVTVKYWRRRLVDALELVAQHKELRPSRPARGPRREADQWDDVARHDRHPELQKAILRARRAEGGLAGVPRIAMIVRSS